MKKRTTLLASRQLIAIMTLIGTIVGAGILGIPYVIAKAGVLYGFGLIILMGLTFLFLNLFMGEVTLRTKGKHQLTGYAEKYLGSGGKILMAIAMALVNYGALTAYLIGEGATLSSLFSFGSPLMYTLIFFIISFLIVIKGVKATGNVEFILISILFLVVLGIGAFSFNSITLTNFADFDWRFIFLPYGVILFSLMGTPAIPEMHQILYSKKKLMKKSIIIGTVIPPLLYIFFSLIVVGIVGVENFSLIGANERIATIALSLYSHHIVGVFANVLAVIAMFTSFLTLSLALVQMYEYDYNFSKWKSVALTFILPLILAVSGLTTFITVLGFTGAFAGALEACLVIFIYWRAKKKGERKPEYSLPMHKFLGSVLVAVFVVGILYQIWSLF